METTVKKQYQHPALRAIQMRQPLLQSISGENFNPDITASEEEGV